MTPVDSPEAQSKLLSNVGAYAIFLIACFVVCLAPDKVWALQVHSSPEGLYVHQLAHILFAFSMAVLAYWLEINRFVDERGWRLIQISCLLFLLWNLVAFTGHYVEVKIPPNLIEGRVGSLESENIDGRRLSYFGLLFFETGSFGLCSCDIMPFFRNTRSLQAYIDSSAG